MNSGQRVNPYIAGPALNDDKGFFGRQDILDQVAKELENEGVNALVLFGQRRIGKTSLLYQLKRSLHESKFLPIYFDLQDQSRRPLGKVLADLAETVAESIELEVDAEKFDNEGRYFRKTFLSQLYKALGNRRPVFLFDEFDVIDQMPKNEITETSAASALFPLLRKIISESRIAAFVFTVGRQAKDLSPEFNTVLNDDLNSNINATLKGSIAREVWVLDEVSAKNLILQAERNNTLIFSANAVERIINLTNSHPYLLQLLCQRIWQLAYEKDPFSTALPTINVDEVEASIPDALEAGGQALTWLWDGFSPAEKIYAAAFAETAKEKEKLSKDSVIQVITENAPRLRTREVERAPQYLQERHILEQTGNQNYCFAIELLRLWIKKNKPLNTVKDALDKIDPLADNTFSSGQEFFNRRMWTHAINQFRAALEINPRHFRARFQLGEALLQSGQIDSAVIEFEFAYNLDQNETRLALSNALINQAKKELELGNYIKTIEICNKTLLISPREQEAQNILAKAFERVAKAKPQKSIPTRPTLVIGLGGTGQWVLTMIKRNLMEINNDQMPQNVRLLCFDTTSRLQSNLSVGDSKNSLTSIRLDDTEFVSIAGNVYDLAKSIRDGQEGNGLQKYPQIASWFDAQDLLQRQSGMTFNLTEGSGQIRALGRLSLFNDILRGAESRIITRIENAIKEIGIEFNTSQQLEIILIASSEGGTGAGMLVDMGIMVRQIASNRLDKNVCLRGFLIAPRVTTMGNIETQARSFAVWRELNRFMMIGGNYGQRVMRYAPLSPELNIKLNRLFDVCYIVEARTSGENSLENIPLERGLYPTIANIVSVFMDADAGQKETEYITSNMAGTLDRLPRSPYYSAIGAYCLKVPVYFERQIYSHKSVMEALEKFLQPIKHENSDTINGVSLNQNYERPNYSGYRGAMEFMRAYTSGDFEVKQTRLLNAPFLQVVADIREKRAADDENFILHVSISKAPDTPGTSQIDIFWRALVSIGDADDERSQLLFHRIKDELYYPLYKSIPPSRLIKDDPDVAFTRIEKETPKFISDHYGQKLSDGTERYGIFGQTLDQIKHFQVDRFREFLYLWLGVTLNGTSEDVERALGGKLGYARDVLNEIKLSLDYFNEFLYKVRRNRSEYKPKTNIDIIVAQAFAYYQTHKADKCWLTFWDNFTHPRAHMSQLNYLRAEQRRINERKYDILLSTLGQTADEMNEITLSVRNELDDWIKFLATGDTRQNIEGLYNKLSYSLSTIVASYYVEKQYVKSQKIISGDILSPDRRTSVDVLRRFKWRITQENEQIKVGLSVDTSDTDSGSEFVDLRHGNYGATEYNLRLLLGIGEAFYEKEQLQRHIGSFIVQNYSTPEELALLLGKQAEPLYVKSPYYWRGPKAVSLFTCFDSSHASNEVNEFMNQVVSRLDSWNPMASDSRYELIPSSNPYQITLVRSDDLLLPDAFELWHRYQDAYRNLITQMNFPPDRLHIFPAERNASLYELEIYKMLKLPSGYKILHEAVVSLLEDRSSFECFFLCFTYGIIQIKKLGTQDIYILDYPGIKQPIHLSKLFDDLILYHTPDILNVIDVFVNKGSSVDNDQLQINMVEVKKTIQSLSNEVGADGSIERLQFQLSDPTGFVQTLWQKIEKDREGKSSAERPFISMEYEDLANLATVIYMRAISSASGETL